MINKTRYIVLAAVLALVLAFIPAALSIRAATQGGTDTSKTIATETDNGAVSDTTSSVGNGIIFDIESAEAIARQIVAARNNVASEDLVTLNATTATLPTIEERAFAFKLSHSTFEGIESIYIDEHGVEVDEEELFSRERDAYTSRYGKLDKRLADQLATAPEDVLIDISIMLHMSYDPASIDPKSDITQGEVELFLDAEHERYIAAVRLVTAPIVDRITQMGYEAKAVEGGAMILATMDPEGIRTVNTWDEVRKIYLTLEPQPASTLPMPEALSIARPVIGAGSVHNDGITGLGTKVGIIEVDGGIVSTSNPYLSGITQDPTDSGCVTSTHATEVAGVVKSSHSADRGIAPDTAAWVTGLCTGTIEGRSDAAIQWGARTLNLSWGNDTSAVTSARDEYYDGLTINDNRTIVVASGNSGTGNAYVWSPGLAYNVITVGAFDDNNTTMWSDDTMASFSSYIGPISYHGDREKPEVVAPGANIRTTSTAYPWFVSTWGTSFAAPMVTGIIALLHDRIPTLVGWPEIVKAITIATAEHNIEGAQSLSSKDGAGGVRADRADNVATGTDGDWEGMNYSCVSPSTIVRNIYLVSGKKARIAVAWNNRPDYYDYSLRPSADLDILLKDPWGNVVASSTSRDNTYEIIQLTPSNSGTHTLEIVKTRCDLSPVNLGWAWWQSP